MTTAAIILAAGQGSRAGGTVAKQWQRLAGQRVIDWTLDAFHTHDRIDQIQLVIRPADAHHLSGAQAWTAGGDTRAASVLAGLEALAGKGVDRVLIHDVARPCISHAVIDAVLDALQTQPAAAPALAVTDALWAGSAGQVHQAVPRDGLFRAQTPQGFDFDVILAAHRTHGAQPGMLDDVAVAMAAGIPAHIVPGDENNLKITMPADFDRAERILQNDMDIRLGNGFDVHKFGDGDHVTLCGITVPHSHGLVGHSDADVGMHAVTDAIYGALALGDIGQHFPPSDPQWKGAASDIFLRHAADCARERGFEIGNVDCTLVCEFPKIGPHAAAMQARMASILAIAPDRVSIKATTSEKLGFTGRGEGIAALATAALIRR